MIEKRKYISNLNNRLKRENKLSEKFAKALSIINPDIKIVGVYHNRKTRIIVKDLNNIEYSVVPADLIKGMRPTIKMAVDSNMAFSVLAKKIHGEKYTYENVNYIDTRKKVSINCKLHGYFFQKPLDHMRGSGCPVCGLNRTINNLTTNHVGWNLKKWEDCGIRNNGNPIIYIIKIYDHNEIFIKIGKTYKGVYNRFKCNSKSLPYNFDVIRIINGDYNYVYNMELELNRKFKNYKYIPNKKFHGFSECFTINIINLI